MNQTQTGESKPRCSVVIRAFNEEKHIGRLLEGIFQQNLRGIEIVLVDSGSTDATIELASRYPIHVVHISPDVFTFGGALNLGIAQTHGEFIIIASAHVYPVYPDWLDKLLAPFEDPGVGLTYGKQRGNSLSNFSEQQVFHQWFPDCSQPRQMHPFCNNANAAIRRSLWERHPYDETLTGLEDLEWAHWAMEQGYTIAYVAEAEVIHVHNETPRSVYNRYRREAMGFKRIFPHERFGMGDFLRLVITNIISDIWQAKLAGALLPNLSSILWFRWMQFWGTYQGYRRSGPITWQLRQTFYYPRGFRPLANDRSREIHPIQYNS